MAALRCLLLAAAIACAAAAGSGRQFEKVAVVGMYRHTGADKRALDKSLRASIDALGPVASVSVIQTLHPTTIDVTTDDRISVGARPGLLMGARRGYEDLVDTGHVAEYLGHVDALTAFLGTQADVGLMLYHPDRIDASAASSIGASLASAARTGPAGTGGGAAGARSAASAAPLPGRGSSSRRAESSVSASSSASAANEWDVLLLGYDVPPLQEDGSSRSGMAAALMGQGAAPGGAETMGMAAGAGTGSTGSSAGQAAVAGRKMGATPPPKLAVAKQFRGLYAYAVTRAGASALLATATPMNVRWWAQVAAQGELGEVRVLWAPDGSARVGTTAADPPVTCDLCDLPAGFSRITHVRDQLLLGGLLGYAAATAALYALGKVVAGGAPALLSAAISVLGRKGSDSSAVEVDELQQAGAGVSVSSPPSRARLALSYIAAVARHPVFHMAVLGGVGYAGAKFVVQPPWPAERFSNTGQLGALQKVALTGRAADDWSAFAAVTNSSRTQVHHATVSTLNHPNLQRLISSAAWYGDEVRVLGMNDPRFVEWGKGFGVKLELVHEYARSLPPDDLLLFTDAFDVLLMTSHDDVREAFLQAVKLAMARERADPAGAVPARVPTLLFSAEFFCHPDPNRTVAYPEVDRQYADFPYLNSGTFIGRAGDIARSMDIFSNYSLGDDDQRYWTDIYLASRRDASLPRIVLDHENDVFLCMSGYRMEWHLDFDPALRRYKYKKTPGLPTIIHFNGRKDDVGPFFEALLMKWSPYSLSTSMGLRWVVAILVILAMPAGMSIGRALDTMGFGLGAPAGYSPLSHGGNKGCCAACRRRVHVAATTGIAAAAVAGIPVPVGPRHEKGDE